MTQALSPLFTDHSDLSTFNQAVSLNASKSAGNIQQQQQQFWATPPRAGSDPTQDVLEVALPSARLVNTISLDVARYPHMVTLQYAGTDGNWQTMTNLNGSPATALILQSVPAVLPRATAVPGHLNPQHSYSGHWEALTFQLVPVRALRIRVILQRMSPSNGPVNGFGQFVNYSLAVMNFEFGYRVASKDDIPRTALATGSLTTRDSIATTDDLLGSSVDYALRVNGANNIIENVLTNSELIWKSEPQPFANAVVNFYADMRDANGDPQIFDQIFIDPINNGAHVTVYYSNDTPVGGFNGVAEPLTATQATLIGTAISKGDVLHLGNYGENASVNVVNSAIGFDPSLPWWIGIRCQPNFQQGVDTNEHVLFDCGDFRISITPTGGLLRTNGGDSLSVTLTYNGGQDYSLVAAYTGVGLHFHVRTAIEEASVDQLVTVPIPADAIAAFSIGSMLNTTLPANVELSDFVLKEELWTDDSFLDDPDLYSTVAEFSGDDNAQSANALVRLDSSNALTPAATPTGLFGGPGAKYDNMVWTPIPRDYIAQRGWMNLPPIKARFINLEFTNLPAFYNEVYVPTGRRIRTFPPSVLNAVIPDVGSRIALPEELGLTVLASLTSGVPYKDFPIYVGTGGTTKGYSNTEAYVVDDYAAGQRLYMRRGSTWAYQNWHGNSSAPRWHMVSRHAYSEQIITSTSKIGFGVGLRQIQFARTIYTASDDVGAYEDSLFDQLNLSQSNWVYDSEREALFSGAAIKAVATSTVFNSTRQVRGVQFAAQQSPPVQLLADPDFNDPQYRNWNFIGDAIPAPTATVLPWVGTVLDITRSLQIGYWVDVAVEEPTWGDLRTSGHTYGDFVNSMRSGEVTGGVSSEPVPQPIGGRLYAAARVVADQDLTQPLAVQIVDSVTGTVLAQSEATVKRDQVVEWYASYDIGESGGFDTNDWGDLYQPLASLPSFTDAFTRANTTSLGMMDSGATWGTSGSVGPLHIVSNKATVTSLGQRSEINTETPWGTLTVVLSNVITGGPSPLIDLGDIQVMNDGTVVNTNTSYVYYTIAGLTAADSLVFDCMSTQSLISAQRPGGASNSVTPWAIAISKNGTWLTTVLLPTAIGQVRALMGAVNQAFTSFHWVPRYSTNPITSQYRPRLPMPTDGSSTVFNSTTNGWLDGEGHSWIYTNTWVFSTLAAGSGSANVASTATSTPGSAVITTDVGEEYGTAEFWPVMLNSLASAAPVFYLDYGTGPGDHQLFLDSAGRLVDGTGAFLTGSIVPNPMAGPIQIRYMKPSWLEAGLRTTWGVSVSDPQVVVIMQNGVILGMKSGTGLWQSTVRGIAGQSTASTSAQTDGFSWSPEASQVIANALQVLWQDVSGHNTKTWADLEGESIAGSTNAVEARVVQLAPSSDSWSMDDLSLFFDPIIWEFSNDGGNSWLPGHEIRNNPTGVVLFPTDALVGTAGDTDSQLMWRVTAWGPDCWISQLTIRPWYTGLMRGIPARTPFTPQGPNVNPYDHYSPIEQDPRFQVWNSPIPREWYFAYRSLTTQPGDTTSQWTDIIVGDAIPYPG